MDRDTIILDVTNLSNEHVKTWRDKEEYYWLCRLMEEVGELGASLANDHEDSPDHELTQIAAICINWLDMRLENGTRENEEWR